MGSEPAESRNQWPASRLLRLVVPSLVVLLVALVLRDRERQAPGAPERHVPPGVAAETSLAPAAGCRLLLLGDDVASLAEALRPKLRNDIALLVAPPTARNDLMRTYGVKSLPAIVIERADAKAVVRQGKEASLAAFLGECRSLGLLKSPE
jgi:hypothetical protein